MAEPLSVYRGRIGGFRARIARLDGWDTTIVWARTMVFIAAIVIAVVAVRGQLGARWLIPPGAVFLGLVIAHGRVLARRGRLRTAVGLCEDGIARIEDRWAGKGDAGTSFQAAAETHLYAADLDLFGAGGLFELLSVARAPIGRATLAAWLQGPASAAVARGRQGAVAELGPRLDLRQDLAMCALAVKEEVREEALTAWAVRAPEGLRGRLGAWRVLLALVGLATLAGAVLWSAGVFGPWPFIGAFVVGGVLVRQLRQPIEQIIAGVDHRADELKTLAVLMARLEREHFEAPALRALRAALDSPRRAKAGPPPKPSPSGTSARTAHPATPASGGLVAGGSEPSEGSGHDFAAPSRRIAELRRLVDLLESRRNQFAALLMIPLQATAQLALAVESWRRAAGPAVLRWMAAVGEVEALSSLATFHFEHPEYPFPSIVDGESAAAAPVHLPVFDSEGLGHPLIPAARRVVNDLRLGGERRLILVSGSNMSGKSTLLRTVGVNTVLALAGAPVCARTLALSPLALGATLRINDSLQAGKSRFYAELTRLKQIVDRAAGTPPLLFLLDEILHGTNSHDRRIGAEAIIRGLIERGAIGLVTTHDLALAEVAAALGVRAANVHFEDHLEGGVMTFDYRMKDGIVRKSNALELMRAVGLEV